MLLSRVRLLGFAILFAVLGIAFGQRARGGGAIEWIPVPGQTDQFYMAQRTSDGKLLLTPDESFFPKLGLRAEGQTKTTEADGHLNGGASFSAISGWDQGEQAEWGVWLEEAGDLRIEVWMSQTGEADRFALSFGEQKKTFAPGRGAQEPRLVATLSLRSAQNGRHSLLLSCENKQGASRSRLHKIEISGPAAGNSAVLRKRWRPAAAHARFSSSQAPEQARLWIMEMDAMPGDLGFYSPVTTPFGYYGPTWLASGVVNTSFNFSLWSYGRGQEEPPIERLSHLLAIGSPEGKFSGFGHEGTGVKIRGWEPLEGRQGQRQAIALRVEPGEEYNTYFSYFFANDEGRWRLFGVGNKYNKRRPLKSLTLGSFVEVPGAPSRQRTGPYERRMRYRGWFVDAAGQLLPLDRMRYGDVNKSTGLTGTDRGVTDDGWFYLETGGWIFRKARSEQNVALPPQSLPKVEYLDRDDIEFLQSMPCEITAQSLKQTAQGTLVAFDIRNLGEGGKVEIFWGDKEALTFAERWANQTAVAKPREGKNEFLIKNAPLGKPIFARLLLSNPEGQFWSRKTLKSGSR